MRALAILLVAAFLLVTNGTPSAHAEDGGSEKRSYWRFQNSPAFLIQLAQVDPDARGVSLEVYDWAVRSWRSCGDFFLRRERDRAIEGGITFRAGGEGEYLLRSVARDRVGNVENPGRGPDSADIVAVYDVTPPTVDVISPTSKFVCAPGKDLRLVWRTRESYPMVKQAVAIEISRDGGDSWASVASGLDDSGEHVLAAPMEEGAVVLRVTVWDRSGNRGEGLSPLFEVRPNEDRDSSPLIAGLLDPVGRRAGRPKTPVVDPAAAAAAREHYRVGAAALVSGRHKAAVSSLRDAVSKDPTLKAAWLDLSVALARAKELKAARKILVAAEKRFPQDAAFPYNRGLILMRSDKPDDAKLALARACHLDSDHAAAHWALAKLAVDAGNLREARARWRQVIRSPRATPQMRAKAQQYLRASQAR